MGSHIPYRRGACYDCPLCDGPVLECKMCQQCFCAGCGKDAACGRHPRGVARCIKKKRRKTEEATRPLGMLERWLDDGVGTRS